MAALIAGTASAVRGTDFMAFSENKRDFAGAVLTPPLTKGENHFAPFGNPRSLPPRQERGEYELTSNCDMVRHFTVWTPALLRVKGRLTFEVLSVTAITLRECDCSLRCAPTRIARVLP